MKKYRKLHFLYFLILLVACQKEEMGKSVSQFISHSFVAFINDQNNSNSFRTAIDDNGNVTWIQTDELGVYGFETQNAKFLSDGSGSNVTFTGNLISETDEIQWAYYPYEESALLNNEQLTLTLPTEYVYTGMCNAPMVGKRAAVDKLTFKHLTGLIRFTLCGGIPENAERLVITSVNTDQPIAGQAIFNIESPNATLTVTTDSKQKVTYQLGSVSDSESFQYFFVPLPVGSYDQLKVDFYLKGNDTPQFTRSISDLTVQRAQLIDMPILNWETGIHPYVEISQKEYELDASKQDLEINTPSNVRLNFDTSDNWIGNTSIRKNWNGSIYNYMSKYRIKANETPNLRTASIIITNEEQGIYEEIIVKQKPITPIVNIKQKEYELSSQKQFISIEIRSNIQALTLTPSDNWIGYSAFNSEKEGDEWIFKYEYQINENSIAAMRTATINISNEVYGISENIVIKQHRGAIGGNIDDMNENEWK